MRGLDIIHSHEGFLEGYEGHKATLLDYLRSGTVSRDDLNALFQRQPTDFEWDLVFVDEGQDWPPDEIEILHIVYGPDRLAVSDGIDQFVRESVADWSISVPK